jgi:juvenile hormone epoxide hydrolase
MCGVMAPWAQLKMLVSSLYPKLFVDEKHVDYYYPLSKLFTFAVEETGYLHIQATKPDTIGTVLSDTPIGLAAYIIEKFSTWTNKEYRGLPDGGLEKYFTMDALLDNVMIYYLTNSILTSQRLYAEGFGSEIQKHQFDRVQTSVPVACAKFKYELLNQPDFALRDKYVNLIQSNHFEDGGHFAAMQLPDVLYNDFVEFVSKTL